MKKIILFFLTIFTRACSNPAKEDINDRTLARNLFQNGLSMRPLFCLKLLSLLLAGCDPVHSLLLENGTKDGDLEVLYASELYFEDKVIEGYELNGDKSINRTKLAPGETMEIGTVHARYQPKPEDVRLDYLEIRYRNDTIVLRGRHAIFSTIQKIENLDWRFVVK